MFIQFVSRQEQKLLINVKDISFVAQKGTFCDIYIRGVEGCVSVVEDFSEVFRKIKDILPLVNNTDGYMSGGDGRASECLN